MRLKSESLLSKTDLTIADFVPVTPSGLNRVRSLSEILNDSSDNSLPVLQPIKIYSQDSDDDNASNDDVSDDDVSNDDVIASDVTDKDFEDHNTGKVTSPPKRPVRPGPPPKPKRSVQLQEHDVATHGNEVSVKTKPERPKPFTKSSPSPAGSPLNKRKTPPGRPGQLPSLPAEKTTPASQDARPTRPTMPPRKPGNVPAVKTSIDQGSKPVPPARPPEHIERQKACPIASIMSSKTQIPSVTVEDNVIDHESKPVPPVRPRSHVEQPLLNIEKETSGKPATLPRKAGSVPADKSTLDNETTSTALNTHDEVIEKQTDNKLSTKSMTPPPRPVSPPHRPSPPRPPTARPNVDKDKETTPHKAKVINQVKEPEGSSLRQRLGSIKFSRKQPRKEEVCYLYTFLIMKLCKFGINFFVVHFGFT